MRPSNIARFSTARIKRVLAHTESANVKGDYISIQFRFSSEENNALVCPRNFLTSPETVRLVLKFGSIEFSSCKFFIVYHASYCQKEFIGKGCSISSSYLSSRGRFLLMCQ